jgi:hypothetical protein
LGSSFFISLSSFIHRFLDLTASCGRHILPIQLNGEPGSQAERSVIARPGTPDLVNTSGGKPAFTNHPPLRMVYLFSSRLSERGEG